MFFQTLKKRQLIKRVNKESDVSELTINRVIIHQLNKVQHKEIKPSNIRPEVLDANSEIVQNLVNEINALYCRKGNNVQYGVFIEGEGRGSFPDSFESYSANEVLTDKDFIELTKKAMESLYIQANAKSSSSGGYILFVDCNLPSSGRFFITAMVKQKAGVTLDDSLDLKELLHLDITRLHQAARINFSKYMQFLQASDEKKSEINYLNFVSPKTNAEAAGYFITALGCTQGCSSARATADVVRASVEFFESNEELKKHSYDIRQKLHEHLGKKAFDGESVKLSEIEKIAREFIPADDSEKVEELADSFVSHLNGEKWAIPVEFTVHTGTLKKQSFISSKTENWKFEFNTSSLGCEETSEIFYDEEEQCIVIRHLPEKVIESITKELAAKQHK